MHAYGEHVLIDDLRRGRQDLSGDGARTLQPESALNDVAHAAACSWRLSEEYVL
jgi:hypothetical protein